MYTVIKRSEFIVGKKISVNEEDIECCNKKLGKIYQYVKKRGYAVIKRL